MQWLHAAPQTENSTVIDFNWCLQQAKRWMEMEFYGCDCVRKRVKHFQLKGEKEAYNCQAVSVAISPKASFSSTAFLYTKQSCSEPEAGLWQAQIPVTGQLSGKEFHREMHYLPVHSKPYQGKGLEAGYVSSASCRFTSPKGRTVTGKSCLAIHD